MPRPSFRTATSLGVVSALFVALAGCGRGPEPAPVAPPAGPGAGATDDGPGYMDPTLGGSTVEGTGAGLAILNPTNTDRPFFRDFGRIPRGESRDWTIE